MARKKIIRAKKKMRKQRAPIAVGRDRRDRPQVRERRECRTDKKERPHRKKRKWNAFRMREKDQRDERDQQNGAVAKEPVNVKSGSVGKNDIGHGVARDIVGIVDGVERNNNAHGEKDER